MLFVVVVIVVFGFLIRHKNKCDECLAATDAWCDAGDAFTDWRLRNQGVYIGLSEKGRLLLHRNLEGYDWFCRTHPFIDGTKHREWLISLFYDFPPKHPNDAPANKKTSIQTDARFLLL